MEEDRKLTPREREIANRNYSRTGAENRYNETAKKNDEQKSDVHRADMNGNKGKFETEHPYPLEDGSAIPGAEEDNDIGTAASGAGLGGNKGTGTINKKNFQ